MRKTFILPPVLTVVCLVATARAGEPDAVPAEQFDALHALVKPQPGESRWMEIPWLTSVWEARQQAAAEGKPIFIWAGSGGGPVGVC